MKQLRPINMLKTFCGLFLVLLYFTRPVQALAADNLWKISSVDTMKYSRDGSRDPKVVSLIPVQIKAAADLGANYVALDTPYDDEFIPRLTLWVAEARKNNLKIWFRGNFSGWEGWFDYPKLKSSDEHINKTFRFITQNPDLFEDGDIFTPAPEAEAGILGDPRQNRKFDQFNKFLLDSYQNCNKAFGEIKREVNCGVWSLNTDVIRETVYKSTIQKMGGIISIDHYTKSAEKLVSDVEALKKQFNAKVVLGEFGAPIPDINGKMTDREQGQYMAGLLAQIYRHPDLVYGMNYWVLNGGSTSLINGDNSPRQAYLEIQKYYRPIVVSGTIKDRFNQAVPGVTVAARDNLEKTSSDNNGDFKLVIPAFDNSLNFSRADLISLNQDITDTDSKTQLFNYIMDPAKPDFWYNAKLWIFKKFNYKL